MRPVLFVTSNGFGLGHVTRCMAIGRRLPEGLEPIIFTLSEALPIVRRQGFYAEYFSSRDHEAENANQWQGRLARRIESVLGEYDPAAVVFDGTYPYRGLLEAMRGKGTPFVWCRRGMWRPGEGAANIRFADEFDLIIEPGEFAGAVDTGLTARGRDQAVHVPPILLCDDSELLDREAAAREIGLEPGRVNVLMQPGWENQVFGPSATLCVERLREEDEVQLVVAVSPLRSRAVPLPDGVAKVSTYPLASVYRAFDFSISGAGYNIYHELIAYGLPGLFIPNAGTPLDDQVARARFAQDQGVGRNWETRAAEELEEHMSALLDEGTRAEMSRRARELSFENGAGAAARSIAAAATAAPGAEAPSLDGAVSHGLPAGEGSGLRGAA
jgi:UDP:flavonoid glycosyltransferase YjiC (YdhE family)